MIEKEQAARVADAYYNEQYATREGKRRAGIRTEELARHDAECVAASKIAAAIRALPDTPSDLEEIGRLVTLLEESGAFTWMLVSDRCSTSSESLDGPTLLGALRLAVEEG